ncbi:MAG: NAD(P)-dependent oxidoreductase [Methanococcoides sp.]|nr:NAD(P)-dependent oxidoreductase [Methanococcoides sp.]
MNNFWTDKKVLITGGLGFVGSNFVEELLKMGAYVTCVYLNGKKNTLTNLNLPESKLKFKQIDLQDYNQIVKECKQIDVIINCAALDGNTEFKINHSAQIMDVNLRITSNILNSAKMNQVEDVVMISSAEIYSVRANNPIDEDDDHKKYNDYTANGYILSKQYGEILSELYENEYGMNIYRPRPTNIYGPRDHFGDGTNRVIPSIIKKVLNNETVEIWGDGSQIRQFIYVKDFVYSVLKMVENKKIHKLNIANNDAISILDLAKLISEIDGSKEKIYFYKDKPVGAKARILDVNKLYSSLNFQPRSLEQGLNETINWYKNHREDF